MNATSLILIVVNGFFMIDSGEIKCTFNKLVPSTNTAKKGIEESGLLCSDEPLSHLS